MYKLYYSPGACSMAIHVMLNECNQSVTLEKVDTQKGEGQKPEFLKLNPSGQVPVLVDGDQTLREGAAILIHLCEKHQSPLLPKSGKERTVAIEWLMVCNASLHPAYARTFFLMKNAQGETKDQLIDVSVKMINKLWNQVEQQLGKTPYLCGDQITVADILLTVIANWSKTIPIQPQLGPKTKEHAAKNHRAPGLQKGARHRTGGI